MLFAGPVFGVALVLSSGAMNPRRMLLTAAAGVSTLSLAGCSVSTGTPAGGTTPSATAQNLAIGAALHVTDSSNASAFVTVESVKYSMEAIAAIGQGPKNGVYAIADVLVQDDAGTYNYNPLYVKYQEPDGTTYDFGSGNAAFAGFDPSLGSGSLSAGQKTRGNVAFDVKTKGGLIQVTDPLGAVLGQWTVPAS